MTETTVKLWGQEVKTSLSEGEGYLALKIKIDKATFNFVATDDEGVEAAVRLEDAFRQFSMAVHNKFAGLERQDG